MLVHVNAKVICDKGPDTYIELSFVEEKGFLEVFLDDPLLDLPVLRNAILNLAQTPHKGDAPTSVHPRWLHYPDVGRAMLGRHRFIDEVAPTDILELLLKLGELICARGGLLNDKSRRGCLENCVLVSNSSIELVVVIAKRLDEPRLLAYVRIFLKVVEEDGLDRIQP